MAKKKKKGKTSGNSDKGTNTKNPLLKAQSQFLQSLPTKVRDNFFSNKQVDADTRAEIWSSQADLGEDLVNQYSWATPDERCLKILKHFAPIVEIGCGANAYWARKMHERGIDIMAFDTQLNQGGQITSNNADGASTIESTSTSTKSSKKRKRKDKDDGKKVFEDGFVIHQGGPNILDNTEKIGKRSLFLCYPDEDVMEGSEGVEAAESMGASCLEHFTGDTVIHVGEVYGDTPSMDQAPWGRSSGPQFQQRLAAEYHCILKAKLTNWLHVMDTISVWKRSELCSIVFAGDEEDDNDSDEEVEYRHIPKDETLPTDVA
eukprot:CAMPEP_0194088342 /NCGR_PEP_ID=MMETSP0149-20130528/28743_1 /TAXON_ID=122233 /ORGANISM="Chaetoceros debilis, Strain MM31A-1" /LENGTH=317 /DNA_ID=CAMNT_0038771965 /DNA_START=69 /DNA_END=1018 /DNA_ORIENTATION=+